MANTIITNVDNASVELRNGEFRDDTLQFAAADTFVAGTILARREVANAVVAAADAGNTGDGTVTLATVAPGTVVPIVGAYVLTCTTAVVNGGVFSLADPNGSLLITELTMTVGAGAATAFEVEGLLFTITDAGTDFIVGDFFTLTVAADGDLVPFDPAGDGGEQIPVAILTYEVVRTGAGDTPIRALIGGVVNSTRLIIDVDGDGSNVNNAVRDQLRHVGITPLDVEQLAELDNQ